MEIKQEVNKNQGLPLSDVLTFSMIQYARDTNSDFDRYLDLFPRKDLVKVS